MAHLGFGAALNARILWPQRIRLTTEIVPADGHSTGWVRYIRNARCANEITKHGGKGEWQTSVQSLPFWSACKPNDRPTHEAHLTAANCIAASAVPQRGKSLPSLVLRWILLNKVPTELAFACNECAVCVEPIARRLEVSGLSVVRCAVRTDMKAPRCPTSPAVTPD